jgi:nitronate monooxygenase
MIFMTIATALTKRLGLRYPVIAAPLGRGATPEFLAALAREGSMGFVALMHMSEAEVRQMLSGYVAATRGGDGNIGPPQPAASLPAFPQTEQS